MPTQMPKNGRPRRSSASLDRLDHAVDRVEIAPAVGEGAVAGKNDAVGPRHDLGIGGDDDPSRRCPSAR